MLKSREDYQTVSNGLTYRYEGYTEWSTSPLVRYSDVQDAHYPPVVHLRKDLYISVDFPEYDMLIQEEGKVPLLFTGAHNRLLYELERGLLPRNPNRVIINVDDHDDFLLGSRTFYTPEDIHIGNWGAAGIIKNFWGKFVHISRQFDRHKPPIERSRRYIPYTSIYDAPYHEFLFDASLNIVQKLFPIIQNNPVLLSVDADDLANWGVDFTKESEELLRRFIEETLHMPNLELIHYTVSPYYCPVENAKKQWEVIRQIYLNYREP